MCPLNYQVKYTLSHGWSFVNTIWCGFTPVKDLVLHSLGVRSVSWVESNIVLQVVDIASMSVLGESDICAYLLCTTLRVVAPFSTSWSIKKYESYSLLPRRAPESSWLSAWMQKCFLCERRCFTLSEFIFTEIKASWRSYSVRANNV